MGFMDDILAQQDGGGMLGGLPASWQYQNPESLTHEQKQMMALVGKDGFNLSPVAAPIAGMLSQDTQAPTAAPMLGAPPSPPISTDNSAPPVAPAVTAPAAAPPSFGAGGSPLQFSQSQSLFGGNIPPAAPVFAKQPPIVAADDGEEDTPAANPATAPASPIGVGNVQMPRLGPAAAFAPAANANAQAPVPAAPTAPAAAPSIGDKLMTGYQNLHHGGGLIGSIVASITGKRNDPTGVAQDQASQVANMTARALIAKGVDPQAAIAAVQPGNGEALKTLWNQAFTQGAHTQETDKDGNVWDVNKQTGQKTIALAAKDDKFTHVQTSEGLGGQKSFGAFNTKTGELKPDASTPGGAAPGFGSLLAQGVRYDPDKSGDAYMAQFSPEVQAAAKAYMNGDVMPTGNARKDSIATFAKTIAMKYGQDTGVPVSDATYGAKRKMQTDLASSGNSTMGGILSNGESSFKHLAEYTKSAADQGNYSFNAPGGGVAAHVLNYVTNAGGGSDTQGKVKAINDNLGKYGAEATKFYAGTGGGVEERLNALKEMNATTTSGEEAASYAEKEKSLMLDRLNTKFQEIRNTLGEERGNAEIAKHMPDIQKNIATIDANIAKLRGNAPPAATSDTPAPVALKVGQSATVNGVSIKKVSN